MSWIIRVKFKKDKRLRPIKGNWPNYQTVAGHKDADKFDSPPLYMARKIFDLPDIKEVAMTEVENDKYVESWIRTKK